MGMMDTAKIIETGEFSYSMCIGSVKRALDERYRLSKRKETLTKELLESQSLYVNMLDAQKLLSAISDENTEKTLDYITSMVNKVLSEMFVSDTPKIRLTKKLYGGSKPHINVELVDGSGNTLDMALQSGAGISQVVSFMYAICLIEIRKGRRLLILDERLNGLHKAAKDILSEVIKIFSRGGFQFIFVEYGLNNLGKIYNVEKRGDESRIVGLEKGTDYTDDTVYINDVDLSLVESGEESGKTTDVVGESEDFGLDDSDEISFDGIAY